MLLFVYTEDGETPSLDGFVEELFIAKEFSTTVIVNVVDELCALLTDTGVVKESTAHGPATYMNVSKNCVIVIQHTFVEGEFLDELMGERAGDLRLREQCMAEIATTVNAVLRVNDYGILQGYNQICVKASCVRGLLSDSGYPRREGSGNRKGREVGFTHVDRSRILSPMFRRCLVKDMALAPKDERAAV